MSALIIGASGHLGNAIARELLARDCAVTAIARRPTPAANLDGLAVRYAAGDCEQPDQLDAWIAGHDLVIDAAAPYPDALADAAEVDRQRERARRRMTTLIDAVRRHRARLLFVSSFTTLADRARGIERLQRELVRRSHPYFAIKAAMESVVIEAARAGTPAAVINPTLSLGPWDLKPRQRCFIPRLLAGEAPAGIAHLVNVVDVRDVARVALGAIEAERWGEPIAVVGHNISLQALIEWICELGGAAPPRFVAPAALGVAAAWWSETAAGAIGRPAPAPALAAMLTVMHDAVDPGPAQLDFGGAPRPLSTTLGDAIAWYRAIGYC